MMRLCYSFGSAITSIHIQYSCSIPGVGIHWSTINKTVNIDDNFTMLYTYLLLILDIIIYSLITWYFDALLPGDFGTPQPFYFPFAVCVDTPSKAVVQRIRAMLSWAALSLTYMIEVFFKAEKQLHWPFRSMRSRKKTVLYMIRAVLTFNIEFV